MVIDRRNFSEGMRDSESPILKFVVVERSARKGADVARKQYSPDEVAAILRGIEIAVAKGTPIQHACVDAGISENTYYRWKVNYGGFSTSQVRQIQLLRRENDQLKKRVRDLVQEKFLLMSMQRGRP